MKKKLALYSLLPGGAAAALLLGGLALPGGEEDRSCCRVSSERLVCGKTGEVLDVCCCEVEVEGKGAKRTKRS